MQNDVATIHCPNESCQAPNSQTDKFCQQCGRPLIKQYLWAVGEGIEADKPGDLWGDRYLCKSSRIFLDTKPYLSPETPSAEISDRIKHYLRLVPYRLQVPQVYAIENGTAREILLLQAPIYSDAVQLEGQLMPELTDAWKDATSLRQLNWLWQIAQLWQPLKSEGVASSLLQPKLLRVEGSLVRLLELQLDQSPPTLTSLGQLWLNLSGTQSAITGFLEQLCYSLIQGEVRSSEQLIALLDQALAEVGRSQTRTVRIATRTDKGPSRQRNEDACYPPSGTTSTKSPEAESGLVIVCDGIGGHEGGDVASNVAIKTIQQQLQSLSLKDTHLDPITLSSDLERVTCDANDQISQRNDKEHRYGRQRMGTTLVMALARAHEIYIGHVGDSRAYWITRTGCHQVTLDDDVASREVRLGYTFYRDALQQATSGSLVQALGMSSSSSLHPTVQRFVLDEDCVFLLCSDGLSDYDRVEQCWETEILPILDGKLDLDSAGLRLVEIANTQNGHDNVTIGIVYCQVSASKPEPTLSASQDLQITVPPSDSIDLAPDPSHATRQSTENTNFSASASPTTLQTKVSSQLAPRRLFVPLLLGIIVLLSLGGLAYLFKERLGSLFKPWISSNPSPSSSATPKPINTLPPASPASNPAAAFSLKQGDLIEINSQISLREKRQNSSENVRNKDKLFRAKGVIPGGSVLKVVNKPQKGDLLTLKICSIGASTGNVASVKPERNQTDTQHDKNVQPSHSSSKSHQAASSPPVLRPGQEGLIEEKTLRQSKPKTLDSTQVGECPTSAIPTASANS